MSPSTIEEAATVSIAALTVPSIRVRVPSILTSFDGSSGFLRSPQFIPHAVASHPRFAKERTMDYARHSFDRALSSGMSSAYLRQSVGPLPLFDVANSILDPADPAFDEILPGFKAIEGLSIPRRHPLLPDQSDNRS